MIKDIKERIDNSKDFTIFFVGDSITEGARASSAEKTYVACFTRELAKIYADRKIVRFDGKRHPVDNGEVMPLKSYGEGVYVQNGDNGSITVVRSGIGGNTVQRMINRKDDFICREVGGREADLFIINVGINDALKYDPNKYVTCEVFGENLNALLDDIAAKMPSADVILVTPSYNDKGLSGESCLDKYCDVMIGIAKERSLALIDLHKVWMEHLVIGGENYGQGDWLCGVKGDSCHPGDKGHEVFSDTIVKALFY